MTRVKICGITRPEDARRAIDLGAHALGFVFYPPSPRYIAPAEAAKITADLPPLVARVGVFVDPARDELDEVVATAGLDTVQLHGGEPPDFCATLPWPVIKGFRVRDDFDPATLADFPVAAHLLDAYTPGVPGGTGKHFAWEKAVAAREFGRIILAGGLDAENVAEAIQTVQPYAVDVSSGVEASPGVKDAEKLRAFFEAVRMTAR